MSVSSNTNSRRTGNPGTTGKAAIMAHLVAGYPGAEESAVVAEALIEAGVAALEIQFPFSDPTADGPAIQEACRAALERGFRVRDGFELVRRISRTHDTPIYIMTYASIPYCVGIDRFVSLAAEAGAAGLIVPDLPPDADEGIYAAAAAAGLEAVPVLVSSAREERIQAAEALSPVHIYCALRTGTTGSRTEIGEANLAFLARLRERGAKVMAGFGIQSREQVELLSGAVDLIVVGSALVRVVGKQPAAGSGGENRRVREGEAAERLRTAVFALAHELVYGAQSGRIAPSRR